MYKMLIFYYRSVQNKYTENYIVNHKYIATDFQFA